MVSIIEYWQVQNDINAITTVLPLTEVSYREARRKRRGRE